MSATARVPQKMTLSRFGSSWLMTPPRNSGGTNSGHVAGGVERRDRVVIAPE
jgi:hypothetical protein